LSMEVPDGFICPISQEIMKDPVMDPEGNTYERCQIELWLSHHQRSPLTNSPLTANRLIPNRALRDSIATFLEKNPGAKVGRGRELAKRSGSFVCSDVESPPWMQFEMRGDKGAEVQDFSRLGVGALVSIACVYPIAGAEAKYRHHGVYIGKLTERLWGQIKDCDPVLLNQHCVVHLQRDEQRPNQGMVEIQTVQDFTGGRQLFTHRLTQAADSQTVLRRALGQVDKVVPYSHKKYNCEHFATWCCQGVGSSVQGEHAEEVETWAWAAGAVALVGAAAMLFSSGSRRDDRRR